MAGKRRMDRSNAWQENRVTDSEAAPKDVYAGKDSNVIKEAESKKRGGRIKKKRGGKVEHHKMEGEAGRRRMDRPGRKTGGRCGADMSPLSSAAKVKQPAGLDRQSDEEGG